MVRLKKLEPVKNSQDSTASTMTLDKCRDCDLVINRKGEKRPAIRCKTCRSNVCFQCAVLDASLCEMMRNAGQEFWGCQSCEAKSADLKSVLDSIQNIHSEMVVIKENQDGQKVEQERMLEGIKVVESVVKRMEDIEKTQADHGERIIAQETSTRQNRDKIDETEKRTTAIEKRLEKMSENAVNVKQTNAIIRELKDLEKKGRNFIIANLPESLEEDDEERKKEDLKQVRDVLSSLKLEDIEPVNVTRVGFSGRYPKKVQVILRTTEECEKVLICAEKTILQNEVWIARDRTWNQREEARLFRAEKEKEENQLSTDGVAPGRGRPRGKGKGPARPPKNPTGSMRGRGSKRPLSGDEKENKWRRTTGGGAARGGGGGGRGARGGRGALSKVPTAAAAAAKAAAVVASAKAATAAAEAAAAEAAAAEAAVAEAAAATAVDNGASPHHQTAMPSQESLITRETTPEGSRQLRQASNRQGTPLPSTSAGLLGAVGGMGENF